MATAMEMELDQRTRDCIDLCSQCEVSCETVIMHCIDMGGEHAQPNHIRALQDCADICNTTANYLARKSEFVSQACDVCARVDGACAEMCEQFEDDEAMRSHAELCRRTAESCRSMARM